MTALKNFFKIFLILIIAVFGYFYSPKNQPANSAENNFTLIWSSNSYVPLNYEGRALPTRGSEIKVVALPIKKTNIDPEKLYYRWLLDDEIMGWANGQGKSSFKFMVDKWSRDYHEIESQILDSKDGNIIWRRTLPIRVASPEILLQTTGSDYAARDTFSTKTGRDITFTAVPLFFHIKNLSEVNFEWSIEGQKPALIDEKNPNQFKLKIPQGTLSESLLKTLSIGIKHKQDQLQQAALNLDIEIK